MSELIIKAEKLRKTFTGTDAMVLDGLDLEVARGDSVAITGPSGSGKSTLLHMLNGLIQADSGRLTLFGQQASHLNEKAFSALRRVKIATVFQDSNLIPTLSIARNIAFRARLSGKGDKDHEHRLIRALGIADVADRYPDQTSGGQRQRGAIAAAFAMAPELLLADEPTGSLDERNARNVADLFFEGIYERGLTAVIVTHNYELAGRCDRVLELSEGVLKPVGATNTRAIF